LFKTQLKIKDTLSRYKVWEYINSIKENKVILLSTHLMEEAEFISGIGQKIHF
jgi:ABC-type multidrug transport system ATPase subunit